MTRERESLELVTDEGALRVGDLCVVRGCDFCGAGVAHRFMLVRAVAPSPISAGAQGQFPARCAVAWMIAPPTTCGSPATKYDFAACISRRAFYRVRTGIESEITGSIPAELTA